MPRTVVRYTSHLDAVDAFARVTDWERHRVPLTTITITPEGFTARTAVGPVGFDDPMHVTRWEPPHRADLQKQGRVVRGSASITVEPSGSGSVVTWDEDVTVIGVPRLLDPVVRQLLRLMVSTVLRRLMS
ncbi:MULTISPECIES: SRPBCC family protein [Aeromicrobium]|uniref:SRPBCC family protein n=1 Tax=Aeromicrobium TaxID=2040 RepID=UPI00257A665D|nr:MULTISPECIES: SRPBCC family protein [Aeromicrobium]